MGLPWQFASSTGKFDRSNAGLALDAAQCAALSARYALSLIGFTELRGIAEKARLERQRHEVWIEGAATVVVCIIAMAAIWGIMEALLGLVELAALMLR